LPAAWRALVHHGIDQDGTIMGEGALDPGLDIIRAFQPDTAHAGSIAFMAKLIF
jgi:hypothetical protein